MFGVACRDFNDPFLSVTPLVDKFHRRDLGRLEQGLGNLRESKPVMPVSPNYSRTKKMNEVSKDELAHLAAKALLSEKLVLDTAAETVERLNVRIAAPVFSVTTLACVPGVSVRWSLRYARLVKAKSNHLNSRLVAPPDLSPGQRELFATSL